MEKGKHGLTITATNSLNQGWRNSQRYSSSFGWPRLPAGRTSAAWSRGWGEEGKCLQAVQGTYVPKNHSPLRKESIQASLKEEEKEHRRSNWARKTLPEAGSEKCKVAALCPQAWLCNMELKSNPRVSTNLRPRGGSGKNLHFPSALSVKGFALSCETLPSYPPLPLGRSCSREIGKASSWAAPLLVQDVSADSLKRGFGFNNTVGFLWKAPGTPATMMSWAPRLGNAFVNDCHSFQPCAALFDGLDVTPVLRCSGAGDKVRCKEINLWHEKSNTCAVCTWQICGLSLFPRKPQKNTNRKANAQ